jgi:DNA-binding response OmpR family regulator
MAALHAGADDVLQHDASDAMIRARMMAIVRKGAVLDRAPDHLVIGDVVVDVDGHLVTIAGDVVRFPMRLFRTLVELARRPNTVVTSEELLHDVWGVDLRPAHRRRLRVAVSSLRRLLGQGAQRPRIETVVRVGYRLATTAAS